jgi:hypothetical protein
MANRDPDYESSHVQVQVGNESQTKEGQDLGYATGAGINGKRLFKIATKGQELVSVPWLDVELTAQLDEGRFIYGQPVQGLIGAIMNYSAQVDNRSINWDVYPQGISYAADTNSPTNKTFDAYVALGWKDDGVPDHPLMGFYQGGSSYSLTAAANGQNTILNNTLHNYQWSASPQTFVPQLPVPTEYERDQMTPAADTSNKTLHWDFGGDITSFPTDADVTATATDSSDGAQVSGHALIHWHSAWEGVDTGAGTSEPPFLILPPGMMVDIPPHLDNNGQPVPASQKPVEQLQPDDKISVPGKPCAGW